MWDPESTAFLNSCCYALLYSENTSPGCTTLGSQCIVAVPPRALLIYLKCMFAVVVHWLQLMHGTGKRPCLEGPFVVL